MLMTLARACERDFADYDLKKLSDDRTILRREAGQDFITPGDNGRLALDIDDVAVLCGYADLRRAGYPVKLAGIVMSRLRAAMREWPQADQLTTVTLQNGSTFTLPAEMVEVTSGYTSGGYIFSANLLDVRNLRERICRVIEANEPEGEEANEAAA